MRPLATVRIRLDELTLTWLAAVADLLEAIEGEEVLASDEIRARAADVRQVMWNAARSR